MDVGDEFLLYAGFVNHEDNHVAKLQHPCGEKLVRLALLFVAMDFFTLLVYPFVFLHGKLYQLSKSRQGADIAHR